MVFVRKGVLLGLYAVMVFASMMLYLLATIAKQVIINNGAGVLPPTQMQLFSVLGLLQGASFIAFLLVGVMIVVVDYLNTQKPLEMSDRTN